MTSNAVLATRALKRLSVVEAGGTPAAADLADTVEALIDMHASWTADGLTVPALPLDTRFDQAVVAMLAVRMAEEFDKKPGPALVRDADRGWEQISSAFFSVPASRFDNAIVYTGHYADWGYILGQGDDNYSAWEPNTEYGLRTYVQNGSNLYECVVAGTSAASGGPTGTDDAITDGTVTWCWRRISGEPDRD
jgi:hypothetical protein